MSKRNVVWITAVLLYIGSWIFAGFYMDKIQVFVKGYETGITLVAYAISLGFACLIIQVQDDKESKISAEEKIKYYFVMAITENICNSKLSKHFYPKVIENLKNLRIECDYYSNLGDVKDMIDLELDRLRSENVATLIRLASIKPKEEL